MDQEGVTAPVANNYLQDNAWCLKLAVKQYREDDDRKKKRKSGDRDALRKKNEDIYDGSDDASVSYQNVKSIQPMAVLTQLTSLSGNSDNVRHINGMQRRRMEEVEDEMFDL